MGSRKVLALAAALTVATATAGGCGTGVNPLECGDSLWIYGGNTDEADFSDWGDILRSFDGVTWTKVGRTTEIGFPTVMSDGVWFLGTLDIAGGGAFTSHIFHSTDGKTFTQVSDGYTRKILTLSNVALGGRFFIIGGSPGILDYAGATSEVFSGTDPLHGSVIGNVPATATTAQSVVFKDQIWILGGLDTTQTSRAEVFASSDGITWTPKTDLPTTVDGNAAAMTLNGRLFVAGGSSTTISTDNVYSTTDGTAWTTVGHLPTALNAVGTTFKGRMWITGGMNDPDGFLNPLGSYVSAVLTSTDGATWTQVGALPRARGPFSLSHFDPCSFTR